MNIVKSSSVKQYDEKDGSPSSVYYNLIRGCLIEKIVINNMNFTNMFEKNVIVDKIIIGAIKKDDTIISPDLLLMINSIELIPVEIKCNVGLRQNNHSYRRSSELALKQIRGAIEIISLDTSLICTRGIIVFVNIYHNNDTYVFDTSYAFV